jgi:hypothetical protein
MVYVRDGSGRETASAYYPPRARWYTTLFFQTGQHVRRRVGLDKLHLTGELSWPGLFASLLVPGLVFFVFGRRLLGWLFFPAYCVASLVFVAALGFNTGSIAYGLMISLHATSIVYLEGHWLRDARFRLRLALSLCTLVGVWALIYAPLVGFAEKHWLLPVRLGERVLIVYRGVSPAQLKRGDWVAYRLHGAGGWGDGRGRVYLESGLAIDPVLGLPGDHVQFSPQGVIVNAQTVARRPYMPTEGELVVPEKVWFIWPNLDITVRGGVAPANISATLQQAAMVAQTNIIGRPSQHWFGRRQWP